MTQFPPAADDNPPPKGLIGRLLAPLRQKSARFLIAGSVNTAVGLAAFPALLWISPTLHEHYLVALVIAQALCLCFAFATYKFGVFRTRDNVLQEFWKFCSFYMVNYVANWLMLPLLVEVGGVNPIIAQFGFASVVIIGSYFWHSRITFKRRKGEYGE